VRKYDAEFHQYDGGASSQAAQSTNPKDRRLAEMNRRASPYDFVIDWPAFTAGYKRLGLHAGPALHQVASQCASVRTGLSHGMNDEMKAKLKSVKCTLHTRNAATGALQRDPVEQELKDGVWTVKFSWYTTKVDLERAVLGLQKAMGVPERDGIDHGPCAGGERRGKCAGLDASDPTGESRNMCRTSADCTGGHVCRDTRCVEPALWTIDCSGANRRFEDKQGEQTRCRVGSTIPAEIAQHRAQCENPDDLPESCIWTETRTWCGRSRAEQNRTCR
jgi:hypothetical protein